MNWLLKDNIFFLWNYTLTGIGINNQNITSRRIIHPKIEVKVVTDFHAITKSICTSTPLEKAISRHPVCFTDSDYECILEEIGCRDKIELERDVEVYSYDEED